MRKLFVALLASLALAGCENRTIWDSQGQVDEATSEREVWNDRGKAEEATRDREVWDSKGKMDTGGRKIWNRGDGTPVIQ